MIFEFDDVTVKTMYCFLSSLEWGPEGGPVGGPRFAPSLLKTYQNLPSIPRMSRR